MSQEKEVMHGEALPDRQIEHYPPHPAETAPMLVNDISHLFHGKMRAQETEGVMSQHGARRILTLLAIHEGLRQTDIARLTHMKPPTVSVTLRKMMAEDLVRQETPFSDLRATKVFLTEKGQQHLQGVRTMLQTIDDILMQGFSEEESKLLCSLLNRMKKNLVDDLEANGLLQPLPTLLTEDDNEQ